MKTLLRCGHRPATGVLMLLLGGCNGSDQALPGSVGLDGLVQQTLHDQGMPGLAAVVLSSDRSRVSVAGVRKFGATAAIAPDDRFHLGSNIKAMTATLAAVLVEAGTIQWTTTLAEIFPELLPIMRTEYGGVTLEQLLAHRGGIMPLTDPGDLALLPPLATDPVEARRQLTAWLLQQPSVSVPGTNATYSNGGYGIAAAMLERRTGQAYDSLLTELVLRPLNIVPLFDWPATAGAAQPWGHEFAGNTWVANDPDLPQNKFPAAFTPAGNLSLSASDYALFVQAHLRGLRGTGGLLSPDSYQHLHMPIGGFALGWLVKDLAGVRTSAHDGSVGTFYALVALQASRDRAVIVLTNSYSQPVANAANALALKLLEISP